MNKPNAYSYIRFSSDAQLSGDSLRRQKEGSAKYAEANGLNLIEDFQLNDLGVSAFKGNNNQDGAALKRFLDAVDAGKIPKGSYLLIESLDRLSRQHPMVAVGIFSQICGAGITIVTISDGQKYDINDASSQYSLFYAVSVMIRANEESETKAIRVHKAWENKRNLAGKKKLTTLCPAWMTLSDDRQMFILNDEKVKIVQRIFDAASKGKGSNLITRELNSEGIPTFGRIEKWPESYITKILNNRAVLGEYQPHVKKNGKRTPVGKPVQDYYPAIISEDLFNAVQAGRRSRSQGQGGKRGPMQSNLFTHLAKCGYCEGNMRHVDKGKLPKGGKYLTCINAKNGSGCVSKAWRYDDFERSFLTFVRDIDLRSLVSGVRQDDQASSLRQQIASIDEKLRTASTKIQNYLIKIEDKPELEEVYTARMIDITRQNKLLEDKKISKTTELDTVISQGIDLTDDEVNDMVALFRMDGGGDRFMLADRIKQVVSKIDMYVVGMKPSMPDAAVDIVRKSGLPSEEAERVIENLRHTAEHGFKTKPHFRVHLKNGSVQIVVPNPNDREKILVSVQAGATSRVEGDDYEWNIS